jgi:hypothetical protein
MMCDDVRDRLLEGSVAGFDELQPHLDRCPDCRAIAERVRYAEGALAEHVAAFASSDGLDEAWRAAAVRERGWRWGASAALGLAVAATLLLALRVSLPSAVAPMAAPPVEDPEPRRSEEPAAPPAPTPTERGTCVVVGEAGASLSIDGQAAGQLPLKVELSRGVHHFEIRRPDGSTLGGAIDVEVWAEERCVLELDAERLRNGEAQQEAPRTRRFEAPSAEEAPSRPRTPADRGVCTVAGEPEAELSVDGDAVGRLPLRLELTRGAHRFELRRGDGSTVERTIDVEVWVGESCVIPVR